jgi:hypothetical protein
MVADIAERMLFPRSLSPAILSQAFRASNGEVGILLSDADAFLEACRADRIAVLGWELWLIDHTCDRQAGAPRPALGRWCGLIPVHGSNVPAVLGGSGDVDKSRREIAALHLDNLIDPQWIRLVRVNFTLDGP